jgi:multicomponent Na+:H+ antiporter subunit E
MNRLRGPSGARGSALPVLLRGLAFLGLWLVLFGAHLADLAVGLVAAAAAAWASLRLLPPGAIWPRPAVLARLALRFLWQSVAAGLDVARRALHPDLPLRPGFVTFRPSLADGPARQAFRLLSSLQPGTLPVGPDEDGRLTVHCLDIEQPVARRMAEEEALFARALGVAAGHE